MFRVFVVDDEPSVIEGLKLMIPWSELGFELCGESADGQDALMEIEKLRPHLVITDIRMPLKNGLDLIKEVRKLNTVTEFVILSGYSEFAYAREAMRHQVFYYLLKPLEKEEIIPVLLKIKNKLETVFHIEYGFSPSDIETFIANRRKPSRDTGNEAADDESGGVWKYIRDSFDEELTMAIKLMNYQDASKLIDELFNLFAARDISLTNACMIVNSLIYYILCAAFERNIKINTILPPEKSKECNFSELKSYITGILSQTIHFMLEDRRKNSRSCLYEAKAYIDDNFKKEISVSLLAETVHLEAGYLGDAFNKQFGCSINEYQHRLRIGKAIELIHSTGMKLSEISAAVGYNNYNNFFAHFWRINHKKPTQYGRK